MTRRYGYLAGRLRQLGLTQEDLARELGVGQCAISCRFNGKTPWRSDEMYEVLDICGASPEELHLYFPRDGIAYKQPIPVKQKKETVKGRRATA